MGKINKSKLTDSYIAGFFDGEGSVYLHKDKGAWRIQIIQANESLIKLIKDFFGYGYVHMRKPWKNHLGKKVIWTYNISRQRDIVDFCKRILPHSFVKREKLEEIYDYLKKHHWHKNYKLQNITKGELEALYNSMSMRKMATRLKVTYNAIYCALEKFGIKKRNPSEAMKKYYKKNSKQN